MKLERKRGSEKMEKEQMNPVVSMERPFSDTSGALLPHTSEEEAPGGHRSVCFDDVIVEDVGVHTVSARCTHIDIKRGRCFVAYVERSVGR